MALDFTSASSQYLTSSTMPLTATPFSMACWFYPDDVANNQAIVELCLSGSAFDRHGIDLDGGVANDPISARTRDASTGAASSLASVVTTGAWFQALGVWASSTSRTIYCNGTAGTTNTTSKAPASTPNRWRIAADGTPGSYFDGRVCEVAVWSDALGQAEASMLAAGFSPLFVRPDILVSYYPMLDHASPAIDRYAGNGLTWTNTPVYIDHPRIIYPDGAKVILPTAAAAGQPYVRRGQFVPHFAGQSRFGQRGAA